jgi:hypothetical protein
MTVMNGPVLPSITDVWDVGDANFNWATVYTKALKSDTGAISVETNQITNLATPTANAHAANKSYVDSAKLSIDLTPTSTPPTLVEGRIYYDNVIKNLVYAKNDNWYKITSSLFTPAPFSQVNLQAWYDASNSSSLSQTSGNITAWNDISGNGRNLNSIIGLPQTGTQTQNGRNVAVFLGNTVVGSIIPQINYYKHTIITVVNYISGRDVYGSSSSGGDGTVIMSTTGIDGGVMQCVTTRGTVSTYFQTGPATSVNWNILVQRVTDTNMNLIANGTMATSPTLLGTYGGTLRGISLGYRIIETMTVGLNGSIGEVLVYDTNLSNTQINTIANYLSTKWNISWTNLV